jgi:mandelate racemase
MARWASTASAARPPPPSAGPGSALPASRPKSATRPWPKTSRSCARCARRSARKWRSWSTTTRAPAEAIERCRALDGEGLTWIEEPTLAHDYTGLAALARATATPIQAGENWWGTLHLQHALDAQASDDVMKIGGMTGWLRAVALAQPRGLRVSNHLWPEISAQLLAATPSAHWLEYADWWNPILAAPLAVRDGMAEPGDAPGSGVAWNDDAVARYLC